MPDNKPKGPTCTGRTATGRPCAKPPMSGSTRCWHHSFRVPGRPTKLDPDLTARMIDAVLDGAYLETAAQAVGVNPSTVHKWQRRAQEAEARALEHFDSDAEPELAELYAHADPADWPYLDFRHALKSAEAFAEIELLRQAKRGANGWQAQMTVLERRHPSRWSRQENHRHEGKVDLGVPKVVAPTAQDKRDAVLVLLESSGSLARENTNRED